MQTTECDFRFYEFQSKFYKKLHSCISVTTNNFAFHLCNVHLSRCCEKTNNAPIMSTASSTSIYQQEKWKGRSVYSYRIISLADISHLLNKTLARRFPKINSLLASTIKGQQTTVCVPRFGNRWLRPIHFHLSTWHRVFTKAAFTHMVAICKDTSS